MYECLYIVTISIIRSRNIIFEPHVKGRMKPIILHWIHQLFKLCEVYKAFCYYKSTTMSLQSIQEDLSVREDILCWQAPNVIFFTIVKFIRLSIWKKLFSSNLIFFCCPECHNKKLWSLLLFWEKIWHESFS